MTASDMMAMLDMTDGGPAKAADPISGGGAVKAVKESDTALVLDKWSLRRGHELAGTEESVREASGLLAHQKDGKPGYSEELKYWGDAAADFHAAVYETETEMAEKCRDGLRHEFIQQLAETQEFHDIRTVTALNPLASEVATAAFVKQFAARRAEAARDEAQGKGKAKGGTHPDSQLLTMQAAAKACKAAADAVNQVQDAANAMGCGGEAAGKMDAKKIVGVYQRVKKSPRLANIAKMAGRFRRLAQSKQRQKVTHGADEVVGVTLGDEIAKLIPAELMKLADPTMMLDTARRLLERQTLCRETRASEPVGKGPIVVTVDESGSMNGERVETAKALALALAWIARQQKRWCALVSFSGGTKITPGSMLLLPPGKTDETKLMDWLEHFFAGGTTMDVPLVELPGMWAEFVKQGMQRGKSDIIMITDAEVQVPDEMRDSFLKFKAEEKAKLTCIVIDGTPGNMACVADEVFTVPKLSTDEDAVGRVLSV